MTIALDAAASSYYDLAPQLTHRTGDIWRDLPSHGVFRTPTISGIVITPACDLAHRKSSTLTYLPVLPIAEWTVTVDFLPEYERSLYGVGTQLEAETKLPAPLPSSFDQAGFAALEPLLATYRTHARSNKAKDLLTRYEACLACLRACHANEPRAASLSHVRLAFGSKAWTDACERIVTNAYRADVHFLPADKQPSEWSAVREHSVALFRAPMTAPIALFDSAQDLALTDWSAATNSLSGQFPVASMFAERRPLKAATLRQDYVHDLLTRFGSLYTRIGSPDFATAAITAMTTDLSE